MQTQYSKGGPFETPLTGVNSNLADQKARASKLKMKMTNSPDLGQEPMRYKNQAKYPKGLAASQDMHQ